MSYTAICELAQGKNENPTVDSLQRFIEALDAFEPYIEPLLIERQP